VLLSQENRPVDLLNTLNDMMADMCYIPGAALAPNSERAARPAPLTPALPPHAPAPAAAPALARRGASPGRLALRA
jgi:hypothetical protein